MEGFLGELIGTMTLILLGNGVVAGVSLKGSYAENGGWIVITTAWGLAVICAVIVALAVGSNAHLNPAVTIGVGIATGEWSEAPAYIAAQFLGALLGAVLVWLHYLPHWKQTDNVAGKRACFCTTPAVRHAPSNVLSEIIGTFMLVFVAASDLLGQPLAERLGAGFRAVSRGPARLGHRPFTRRDHGLRDQPGTRLGSAHRARTLADPWQGQLGLGLRRHSRVGAHHWRRARGPCRRRDRHIRAYEKDASSSRLPRRFPRRRLP